MSEFKPTGIMFHDYGYNRTDVPLSKTADNPYHALVHPDGSVVYRYPENPWGTKGAHAYYQNSNYLGISYAGPVGGQPTPEGLAKLSEVTGEATDYLRGIGVKEPKMIGHGEAWEETRDTAYPASNPAKGGRDLNEAQWYKQISAKGPALDPEAVQKNVGDTIDLEGYFGVPSDKGEVEPAPLPPPPPEITAPAPVEAQRPAREYGPRPSSGLYIPSPTVFSQKAMDEHREAIAKKAKEQDLSFFDVMGSPDYWSNNWTVGFGTWITEKNHPEYWESDPAFKPNEQMFGDIEKEMGPLTRAEKEHLYDSHNQWMWNTRLELIKQRRRGYAIEEKAGPFATGAGTILGLGLDIGTGIALGIGPEMVMGKALGKASTMIGNMANKAVTYGVGAAPEFYLAHKSGFLSEDESLAYAIVVGGGLGSVVGAASTPGGIAAAKRKAGMKNVARQAEEEGIKKAAREGKPIKVVPKSVKEKVTGGDTVSTPVVGTQVRRRDPMKHAEAVTTLPKDAATISKAASTGKIDADAVAALRRQEYMSPGKQTVYVNLDEDFGDVIRAVRQKPATGNWGTVVINKGADIFEHGGKNPAFPQVVADESVWLTGVTPNTLRKRKGKGTVLDYKPIDKRPGMPVYAWALDPETRQGLNPQRLVALDRAQDGSAAFKGMTPEEAALAKAGPSSGGAAATPGQAQSRGRVSDVGDRGVVLSDDPAIMKRIVARDKELGGSNADAILPETMGLAAAWARSEAIRKDKNLPFRLFGEAALGGISDQPEEILAKTGTRRVAPALITRRMANIWHGKRNSLMQDAMENFNRQYAQDRGAWTQLYKEMIAPDYNWNYLGKTQKEQLVDRLVSDIRREQFQNGVDPQRFLETTFENPDDFQFLHDLVKGYNELTNDVLDHLADPGKAIGESGKWMPVANMDEVKAALGGKSGWMPRMWSYEAIQGMIDRYGPDSLSKYLKANIHEVHSMRMAEGLPYLERDITDRIADKMADEIIKGRSSWNTWIDSMFGKSVDAQAVVAVMKKAGFTDSEVHDVASYFSLAKAGQSDTQGKMTFHRGELDETFTMKMTNKAGEVEDVSLNNFIDHSVSTGLDDYIQKAAGLVGVATFQVKDAKLGYLLGGEREVDGAVKQFGVRTDEIWNQFKEKVARADVNQNITRTSAQNSLGYHPQDMLDSWYNVQTHRIPYGQMPEVLQGARFWTNGMMLQNSAFAQISELQQAVAYGGVSVLRRLVDFSQMGENLRNFRRPDQAQSLSGATRYFEGLGFGLGMNSLTTNNRMDDYVSAMQGRSTNVYGGELTKRFVTSGQRFQNFVLKYSGLSPITEWGYIRTLEGLNDNFYHWAQRYQRFEDIPRRMREGLLQRGMTRNELDAAMAMFRDPNIVKGRGNKYFGRIDEIDESAFTPEQRSLMLKLQGTLFEQATRAIQENKWDWLPGPADHWLFRFAMQLQSFMVSSYTAQMVNNARKAIRAGQRMGSEMSAGNMSMTDGAGDAALEVLRHGTHLIANMAAGAAGYIALQELADLAYSEANERRREKERYDWDNLILAGIMRSSILAIVPTLWDSFAGNLGAPTAEGYRTSGAVSSIVNPPALQLGKHVVKGAVGGYNLATGQGDTEDLRDLKRSIMGNLVFTDAAVQMAGREVFGLREPKVKGKPKNLWESITE